MAQASFASNSKNGNYSARISFKLCKTGSLYNLDDLNIVTPITSDKMGHVTIINCSIALNNRKWAAEMTYNYCQM